MECFKRILHKWMKKQIVKKSAFKICYNEYIGFSIPMMLGIDSCGAMSIDGKIYIIWFDEFYNSLSTNEKTFCVLHELGHFANADMNDYTKERVFTNEVTADSYAFKYMSYDKAMTAMINIYDKLDNDFEKNEWRQRMHMQENMEMARQYTALL